MRHKNSTIEINGKRYDSRTGELLDKAAGTVKLKPQQQAPAAKISRASAGRPLNHAAAHTPSRSQILMRKAVKKPGPSLKRQIHAQGELAPSTGFDLSSSHVEHVEKRLQHAKHVPKSQLITHFTKPETRQPHTAHVQPAVQQARASIDGIHAVSAPKHRPTTTESILERGLRDARSHEQRPLKRSRAHLKRQMSVVAIVTLAVGVLTVIAAQNLNGAQLQVASAKAGFSAKLPDYKPAGFSQSAINSNKGVVATQFQSDTDARNYTITQKDSTWDSTELRDNFVAPTDPNYETVASNGITVYIYGNHNAAWVNNGIWYNVSANGSLSDHQLVELATSL